MGRLGEVVVVVMGVRWPAEPMQQEVKGFREREREREKAGLLGGRARISRM